MSTPLTVFFAPMVTVGLASDLNPQASGTAAQIVGLLFIDASTPGTGTGATGFEQMARALLGWSLGIDPSAGSVTLSQLNTQGPARSFSDFQGFLSGAFAFTLAGPQALAKAAPSSLAIFPMFPYLSLGADGLTSRDFSTYEPSSPAYQTFLAQYFLQLAVSSVNRPSTRPNVPPVLTTQSLAQSMFTDYFQILLRQVTNDAANWVQANGTTIPNSTDLTATFAQLAAGHVFNTAAGFVSRFLLHGLRIPDPAAPVPADPSAWVSLPLYPLFALTGQAWQAPATPTDTYKMTLSQGSLQPPSGLFASGTLPLSIQLGDLVVNGSVDGTALLTAYEKVLSAGGDALGLAASVARLAPLDSYTLAPRRFALGKPGAWQRAGAAAAISSFTDPLRTQIDNSLTDLRASTVSLSAPANTVPTPIAATWTTRLDFTIRQATAPAGSTAAIPGVYELHGADQSDRDDLFALLTYLRDPSRTAYDVTVELVYAPSSGSGLVSDAGAGASVLKANLSTSTIVTGGDVLAAADLPSASGKAAAVLPFLTLLWESATVASGGYYLTYTANGSGLPTTLFQNDPAATLSVVVTIAQATQVTLFHNAVIPASPPASDALVLIEPNPQTVPGGSTLGGLAGTYGVTATALGLANATTAFLPAGTSITVKTKSYVVKQGDTLLRIALALNDPTIAPGDVAAAASGVAISLGGAWLQPSPPWVLQRATLAPGNAGFELLRNNPMPVATGDAKGQLAAMFSLLGNWIEKAGGFAETTEGLPVGPIDGPAGASPGPTWTYQRVLSLPKNATANGPDPFTGVGTSASIAVLWHDIFGNRLVTDAGATTLDVPIGYRDPLIPLAQWALVHASYAVGGTAGAATLALRFDVDTSRYDPPPQNGPSVVQQRAAADSSRLLQIYFQLVQPGVGAAVTFTVDGGVSHALAAGTVGAITTFVLALKAYADQVASAAATATSNAALTAAIATIPVPAALPLPAVPIAATYPAQVIFPLDVQVVVSRASYVDPFFAGELDVAQVASSVRPLLTAASDGTLQLAPFAEGLEALFPGLKLASGTSDGSGQLYAVEVPGAKLGYAFPAAPVSASFFAPAPLATAPWSATDVDISPYDPAAGLGSPVKQSFRGIDLDTWAELLLAAVDRVLSAQYAPAFRRLDPPSYDTVVRAKQTIAEAIAARVTQVVGAGGDLTAAQDALREDLLVSLSDGYGVDTIVQVPVTVTGTGDPYRFSFQPKGIEPVPAGATLTSLAGGLGIPLDLLVTLVGGDTSLLAVNYTASFQGKQHVVAVGESLSAVASALGTDVETLGASLSSDPKLLQTGADFGLIQRSYALMRGDTLRSVLDFLAPDVMASGDPSLAVADFLDLNDQVAGILAPGASFPFSGGTVTVAQGETLKSLATRLGVAENVLVTSLLDTPDLLGVSSATTPIVVSFVSEVPGHTLSRATVDVTAAGASPEQLTFLLRMASHTELDNLPVTLSFSLAELEYDISRAVTWAPGFEESSSLTFVVPPETSVGRADIPIPLRVYPPTPVVDKHAVVQSLPAQPKLSDLRAYTYELFYTYARAAQDQLTLSFTYNQLTIDAPPPPAATDSTLDHALAEYASIAPALDQALSVLPLLSPSDAPAAAKTAVQTFAAQVSAIAAQWTTWQTKTPGALPTASHVVRVTTGVTGSPQVTVTPASPSAGPAPAVTPVTSSTGSTAATPAAPLPDQFEVDQPGLDVLVQQSAWGAVTVTRNASLLPGQATNTSFVYTIPDVRAYSPAIPLVSYREPFDMASVSTVVSPVPASKLAARLANFFAELLNVTPTSAPATPPGVRVSVSFGTLLAGSPSASAGSSANIVSLLPVVMSPAFTFNPQVDLLQAAGFCARLAAQLTAFLTANGPALGGARWVFDVSVYSSLAGETSRPVLELTDVQLALTDAS